MPFFQDRVAEIAATRYGGKTFGGGVMRTVPFGLK